MASTHILPTRQKGGSPYIYVGAHPTSEWLALTYDLLVRMAVALTSVLLNRMASTHI